MLSPLLLRLRACSRATAVAPPSYRRPRRHCERAAVVLLWQTMYSDITCSGVFKGSSVTSRRLRRIVSSAFDRFSNACCACTLCTYGTHDCFHVFSFFLCLLRYRCTFCPTAASAAAAAVAASDATSAVGMLLLSLPRWRPRRCCPKLKLSAVGVSASARHQNGSIFSSVLGPYHFPRDFSGYLSIMTWQRRKSWFYSSFGFLWWPPCNRPPPD